LNLSLEKNKTTKREVVGSPYIETIATLCCES